MEQQWIAPFYLIGLATRTTNEAGQAMQDIPVLWHTFLSENRLADIPNKLDDTIYCAYTEYEADYTKPYTVLLGCRVESLDWVPEGMRGMAFPGGNYVKFTAMGNLQEGAVGNEWVNIWSSAIPRAYAVDFEVYGAKAQDPANAEVDIFISVD